MTNNEALNIKNSLYNQCLEIVNVKLEAVQQNILELQEALSSETKSTAGDKYETGRAMLHLEREKAGLQLAEITKTKTVLSKLPFKKTSASICLGSLVITSQNHYFIAVSLGELKLNGMAYYAISPSTPIGQLLLGKWINDSFVFKGITQRIVAVF